jgi:aryl-alcohol dehydrogenase-like predicted oxidoreductase
LNTVLCAAESDLSTHTLRSASYKKRDNAHMRYVKIPGTDLRVSTICLGTGGLGSSLDRAQSFELLDALVALGGNFVDSAKVYADWLSGERSISERTIGRWMKERGNREHMIIGTKGAHPELSTMHIPRLSAADIAHDVVASLEHLQTDYIDLYWLHRDDPSRPAGEIIESLNAHIKSGKLRYIGCSNWRADRIAQANAYAALHGLTGFVADQLLWSLAAINRDGIPDKTLVWMDDELRNYHTQSGLAAIPYSSQANGLFNKMAAGSLPATAGMYLDDLNKERLARIQLLANKGGHTITQVVLGYLLSQPFVTIPIVGCHTLDQLADSFSAVDVKLSTDELQYLDGGGVS